MKTAVEWLIEKHFGSIENCSPNFRNHIEQAKEMEKEQIFKALIRGHNDCGVFTMQSECDEYYNKTFKSE